MVSKPHEFVKTNSKSFNTYFQGFPRGQVTLLYLGGQNQDLCRLALMRLFGHPVNYRLKIFDFYGDCVGKAAAHYKLPSAQMEVVTSMRAQTLMPAIVQDVRGGNPPDVIIVNDMDALIRVNPNDYSRLMAIVMNTPTAIVLVVPISTQRDPRKTRFVRVLKRLEVALPLTLEVGFGDVVEEDYTYTLQVKRSKAKLPTDRKVTITLPYREIPDEDRSRKHLIPSQIIAKGKFGDRGILAGFDRGSMDEGIAEHPMTKPGELREMRPATPSSTPPRASTVGGAVSLSEHPQVLARQLEQAEPEAPIVVAQAQVTVPLSMKGASASGKTSPVAVVPAEPPIVAPVESPLPPTPSDQALSSAELPAIPSLDPEEQEGAPLPEGEEGEAPPSITEEMLQDTDQLPELDFKEETEPGFECISCKRTFHSSFRSARAAPHLALCKYCAREVKEPPATAKAKELSRIFCKHCGAPDTIPISAAQETPDGVVTMYKCKACGKAFLHTTPPAETPAQEEAAGEEVPPPRVVRGMEVVGDRGSPVLGQQAMQRPGEGISANAEQRVRRVPQPPSGPTVAVEPDQQVRRTVSGMPIESGDNQLDATTAPGSMSLNPRTRVSPVLAARMAVRDKVVRAGPISMRIQVRGDGASLGAGVVRADALAGNRGKTDKTSPGGTRTLRI